MTDEIHSRVSAPKDTEGSLSSPTPPNELALADFLSTRG